MSIAQNDKNDGLGTIDPVVNYHSVVGDAGKILLFEATVGEHRTTV